MEKKKEIGEVRRRLDETLALPDLVNTKSIRSLVKTQLIRSGLGLEGNLDKIVEKRTTEVSNFLEMLRSASENEDGVTNDWKVKEDTDQLRVLYREGPPGSPFHTLLSEGFSDGPIDVSLCVSWESTLYKKWWPQHAFPSFKIIMSDLLKRIRVGEEISLIRVKVPWPISDREAVLHYFEIEYLQEDLILILINTISDEEEIDINTHGFTRDGIPKPNGTVRMDLIGGVVLQKVNEQETYFRVIVNADIKLDFLPPNIINFIARQIIGSGHKLFRKAVRTVASSDDDYKNALKNPLYMRIRNSTNIINNPEISQYSISTGMNVNEIEELEKEEEEEEEEWYDAIEEINTEPQSNGTDNPDQTKNGMNNSQRVRNEFQFDGKSTNESERPSLNADVASGVSILDGAINQPSVKEEVSHAFRRKSVKFCTNSEAKRDLDFKSDLLNGWSHEEDPSSRDLRQNGGKFSKEKYRKVGDEGILENKGFNVNGKISNKKIKNKFFVKWTGCFGKSSVIE